VAVDRLAGIAAVRNGGLATVGSRRALEALTLQLPAIARGVARPSCAWQHAFPDVAVKRAIFAGAPLSGLLRGADGAALLVVGDRGLGQVRRALLGSVSQGAIERAGEPVAVVRGDSDRPFSPHDGT